MVVIKEVLAPTDFSECSADAVARALDLADRFGGRLTLLHVVSDPIHETWACYAPGADFLEIVAQMEREARRKMAAVVPAGRAADVRLATVWGDPTTEILKYAKARGVDVIVCGTHGRRGWNRVMMGSVAERLVRFARCPLLTVGPTSKDEAA